MTLYNKIAVRIIEDANKAGLPSGVSLGSINSLKAKYNVSEKTIRNALKELRDQGKIKTLRGSGIFLTEIAICKGEKSKPLPLKFKEIHDDIEMMLPFSITGRKVDLNLGLPQMTNDIEKLWSAVIENYNNSQSKVTIIPHFKEVFDYDNDSYNLSKFDLLAIIDIFAERGMEKGLFYSPENDLVSGSNSLFYTMPVMAINSDIMTNSGCNLPDNSWHSFINTAIQLAKAKKNKNIPQNVFCAASLQVMASLLLSRDFSVYNMHKDRFNWTNPCVLEFLKEMKTVGAEYKAIESDKVFNGKKNILFRNNKIALLLMNSMWLRTIYPQGVPSHIVLRPMPVGPFGKHIHRSDHVCISSMTLFKEEATDFLTYLHSETVTKMVEQVGFLPVNGSLSGHGKVNDIIKTEEESFKSALCQETFSLDNILFMNKVFNVIAHQVMDGVITPGDAINSLITRYDSNFN